MTDSDDKSMDDVLASIRRIVRAEKESSVASVPGDGLHQETDRRGDSEGPMVLTPAMRIDGGTARAPARPELAADTAEASAPRETMNSDLPDREALRAALREILREELSGGPVEEAVRGIIRAELMGGQLGRNISQNVLRMIQDEVAKAVQAPR